MAIGTGITQEGAIKPSSLEQQEYEGDLFAKRITEIPSNMHKKLDYDGRTDEQPVYVGFAARNHATSSSGWLLYKITYDESDRVIDVISSYDSWDNRKTTAVYG